LRAREVTKRAMSMYAAHARALDGNLILLADARASSCCRRRDPLSGRDRQSVDL